LINTTLERQKGKNMVANPMVDHRSEERRSLSGSARRGVTDHPGRRYRPRG
jgi:hypothetical protein